MYRLGSTQRKIILTLSGGVSLGLCNNSRQYYRILRTLKREWEKINQQNFNRSIRRLSKEKLLEEVTLTNGSFKLILTSEGKRHAKMLKYFGSSIKFKKPKHWDKKWRIVIFDIPEKDRLFRDILRGHLKGLKFYKLQQSVFISPYSFEKAILELISFYQAGKYVRVITATKIDNEIKLKKYFFSKK